MSPAVTEGLRISIQMTSNPKFGNSGETNSPMLSALRSPVSQIISCQKGAMYKLCPIMARTTRLIAPEAPKVCVSRTTRFVWRRCFYVCIPLPPPLVRRVTTSFDLFFLLAHSRVLSVFSKRFLFHPFPPPARKIVTAVYTTTSCIDRNDPPTGNA